MKIITESEKTAFEKGAGVGLGNFDGVHAAHEILIRNLVQESKFRNIPSVLYTFREHPGNILQKKKIKLIYSLEKRIEKFSQMGIDYLVLQEFSEEFASMDASRFVEEILLKTFNTKLVVTGFNYNFGKNGTGDVELLKKYGNEKGFDVVTIQPVMTGGKVISSSAIRNCISTGRMKEAKEMLGEYYSISGKVEYGNRIGTLIGFPTANIKPLKDFALPEPGVYFTRTGIEGKTYNSITNIGFKPTIGGSSTEIIETHIFDFSGWLYGREIDVSFIKKHRDEVRHKDIEELKNRIEEDIKEARIFFKKQTYL